MKRLLNLAIRQVAGFYTARWQPWSRVIIQSDNAGWVLDQEGKEIRAIMARYGVSCIKKKWLHHCQNQCVFFLSAGLLLDNPDWPDGFRIAGAYYHGRPGTGEPVFDKRFEKLSRLHPRISRLQVTNRAFHEIILESGIDPAKVFTIPIGINLDYFPFQTLESRKQARDKFSIPDSAVVVGSFQKDGAGWGEGDEPKMIKGPDILLKTLAILKEQVPDLFVLLSAPARGFVKKGLESMRIPYRHYILSDYSQIGNLYQCLDAYIVSSREEGGPKAVLESMASGVPIISTRVGQAADLIQHELNGWLVDSEDSEALAHWTLHALQNQNLCSHVLQRARMTAEANSYEAQSSLWYDFLDGFVQ